MTRVLYDSTNPWDCPPGAWGVAGYTDGRFANMAVVAQAHPDSAHIPISAIGSNSGIAGDCEPGCIWPVANIVDWVLSRRAAGYDPTVYVGRANWPAAIQAFQARGVPEPTWWTAHYTNVPHFCTTGCYPQAPVGQRQAVVTQYGGDLVGHYDVNVVQDFWPGVDGNESGQGGGTVIPGGDWFDMATLDDLNNAVLGVMRSPEYAQILQDRIWNCVLGPVGMYGQPSGSAAQIWLMHSRAAAGSHLPYLFTVSDDGPTAGVWYILIGDGRIWLRSPAEADRYTSGMASPGIVAPVALTTADYPAKLPVYGSQVPWWVQLQNEDGSAASPIYAVITGGWGGQRFLSIQLSMEQWLSTFNSNGAAPPLVYRPKDDPISKLPITQFFVIEDDPSGKVYMTTEDGAKKSWVQWDLYEAFAFPTMIKVPADDPLALLPEGQVMNLAATMPQAPTGPGIPPLDLTQLKQAAQQGAQDGASQGAGTAVQGAFDKLVLVPQKESQ